ncbi:hypothetical protein [Wolbachia endosymbiont (group A) of Epistrophe grossularia]|uniref:hypothetical protein n=1 Tax=Wolbachia endosymbiont (group A) of Epistrophe grossularia TaxID=2954008 RepID=UPI00222E62B0|nr:hypothetical protein [Wolbachia endosymbiont (group A) of Epistrophe grossularia]
MSKNNLPYYIAGTLAALTLLASGVFAAAPYIGFLAPVAALSVGLPFIIDGAVFSAVAMALSYKAISKNKTISEKDVQLTEKVEEISKKDAQLAKEEDKVQAQKQTISGQNDQLTKKEAEVKAKEEENSKQKIEINKKNEEIDNQKKEIEELKHKKTFVPQAMKNIKEASQEVFAYVAEAYSSGRVHSTIKQRRSDVANDLKNVVGSAKNAYGTSVEYVKGKFNSAGNKLKNVYGTSVEYTKGALNSVGSSLYSRFHGTKVSSSEEQFKREDGSKPSMQELTSLDYLDLAVSSSEQKQRANSLDYLNIDNDVPKQPDHLSIDAAKRYLMSLSEDQEIFYDAESGGEKDTETSSLKEQLDENSKAKVPSRISDLCESVKGKFTSFWSGVQSIYSKNVYNSCALGTDLLHAQHKNTLANVPQEEVVNKEAQKPEEQADQKPNLQRDNSINNTEEGGKNKRSGAARRKRKQARVEQPIVYTVTTSNKYDVLLPECFLS